MTCISIGDGTTIKGYVCVNDQIRFHVGNRYVWMSWHCNTGPSFYTMKNNEIIDYPATEEDDPVWEHFERWFNKQEVIKAKRGTK